MDLFEYQGKQLFAKYGIPVSPGEAVETVDAAVAAADRIGYPVVVKAQVQVGGRGKAGGIKLATNADECREHAANILGHGHQGPRRRRSSGSRRRATSRSEYYASFTLDRSAKLHLGMLSAQGGVEIEQVAEENPDAIAKIHVDPVDGLTDDAVRGLGGRCAASIPRPTEGAVDILMKLWRCYVDADADLVEINPLILTPDGRVHALDAKVTLDDNSVFRHPEYEEYDATQVRDARERAAHDKGLQYVGLDGYVGIIANGAGLAMSTVDIVSQVGGKPANFLDIGGGANAEVMAGALEVINNDPDVKAIFINIFGGITKGEEVANGIVAGARPRGDRRPDRDPPRRHERRRGARDPEPHLSDRLQLQPTMLDAARASSVVETRDAVPAPERSAKHRSG